MNDTLLKQMIYRSTYLQFLPFLILGIAASYLEWRWDDIPPSWVVRWSDSRHATGWAYKSPLSVFFPVGLGVAICGMIDALGTFVARHTHNKPAAAAAPKLSAEAAHLIRVGTAECVRIINTGVAFMIGGIAVVLPLYSPDNPNFVFRCAVSVACLVLLLGALQMRHVAKAVHATGNSPELRGWNGITYSNPDDCRVWVPKVVGLGYTLNFSHRAAWFWLLALVGGPMGLVLALVIWGI